MNNPAQQARLLLAAFPKIDPPDMQAFAFHVTELLKDYPKAAAAAVKEYPRSAEFFSIASLTDWLRRETARVGELDRARALPPPRHDGPADPEVIRMAGELAHKLRAGR